MYHLKDVRNAIEWLSNRTKIKRYVKLWNKKQFIIYLMTHNLIIWPFDQNIIYWFLLFESMIITPLEYLSSTDCWSLHYNPVLGKQRIPYNPSLHTRSYEVIRPESASCPVKKRGQWGTFQGITHFFDKVHCWWRPI